MSSEDNEAPGLMTVRLVREIMDWAHGAWAKAIVPPTHGARALRAPRALGPLRKNMHICLHRQKVQIHCFSAVALRLARATWGNRQCVEIVDATPAAPLNG